MCQTAPAWPTAGPQWRHAGIWHDRTGMGSLVHLQLTSVLREGPSGESGTHKSFRILRGAASLTESLCPLFSQLIGCGIRPSVDRHGHHSAPCMFTTLRIIRGCVRRWRALPGNRSQEGWDLTASATSDTQYPETDQAEIKIPSPLTHLTLHTSPCQSKNSNKYHG